MNKKTLIKLINTELEILQDLIKGFSEDENIHPLELEITTSKITNIYNLLLMLKPNDQQSVLQQIEKQKEVNYINNIVETKAEAIITETAKPTIQEEKPQAIAEEPKITEEKPKPIINEETTEQQTEKVEPTIDETTEVTEKPIEPVIEEQPSVIEQTAEPVIEQETKQEEQNNDTIIENKITEQEPIKDEEPEESEEPEQTTKPEPTAEVEEKSSVTEQEKGNILADKFQDKGMSLNDTLKSFQNDKNIANLLINRPITNLKTAININDRIWYIKELFNKDNDLYTKTIEELNNQEDLNSALAYLSANFKWNQSDKSTISFLELIYRRFTNA